MIPELGNLALAIALAVSLLQAILPLIGAARGIQVWVSLAHTATRVQALLIVFAFACLTYSFFSNDFSVTYVANHSNSLLPLTYKISAVWGGHEGSLLLWVLMLSLWSAAISLFSRNIPSYLVARVLAVMGLISIGFLLFILLTSNPFDRLFPTPLEGRDLNPLLQDFGLAVHPPMLYMGYVGFSVAFSFAIAAMIGGRFDAAWARWTRPWTSVAWLFLTLGIALGSWWAYYELGWGGWWFWDPVENASFMPWLVGTALMHSLAATEKRGVFKAWTILLAVSAFSLSLLGTFLVRSGVITSVHAFATDPSRGLFILAFLVIVVGGSLLLYAWRAPKIVSHVQFNTISRETGILLNNILLVVACSTVLLGTLYPLVLDALGLGKISVGPPYFDFVFVLLTAPLALLIGFGALARWKLDQFSRLLRSLMPIAALSIVLGLLIPLGMTHYSINAAFGCMLGSWVMLAALFALLQRSSSGRRWQSLRSTPRYWSGMVLAHFGVGVFIIGVTLTSAYSIEKDLRLETAQSYQMAGYEFRFDGVKSHQGANYSAARGTITVRREGRVIATLTPEKRVYRVQTSPMTEAAIDPGFSRDLYVALGEPIGADGAWAVRIYYKPFIRWIWLGTIFMALGGLLAAADKRYRRQQQPHPSDAQSELSTSAA